MKLRHHIYKRYKELAVATGLTKAPPGVAEFALSPEAIRKLRSEAKGGIHKIFFDGGKRPVHKWHHYLDIYERYLSAYRGRPFFFLEIGVMDGGSLEMWRRYFGQEATIVGIDIDPDCFSRCDPPNMVRIGSQADPEFLRSVVTEFGSPDVILDDGSHIANHQRASFDVLFPLLKEGGIYVIEDVHTAYWPDWEGGYRRQGSVIEYIKRIIDDMHAWYHNHPTVTPARDEIGSIHIYDSVVILEKRMKTKPGFLKSTSI